MNEKRHQPKPDVAFVVQLTKQIPYGKIMSKYDYANEAFGE
jgi:hypothetical protein